MASKPNPVKRPLKIGTIQCTLDREVHPNQKRPAENKMPPANLVSRKRDLVKNFQAFSIKAVDMSRTNNNRR